MNDEYVNKGQVIALAAWCAVVALLATAWVFMLATPHVEVGGMFAASACATSAVAATVHIRCYVVRVMCLVRTTSGLSGAGFDRPRPVRDF